MNTYTSNEKFVEDVKKHLVQYNEWGAGDFRGHQKNHIAKVTKGNRLDIINQIIKSDRVDPDLFTSPHMYAHHLNSSQIVCYEFFRPKLSADREKRINDDMLFCLSKMGIPAGDFKGARAEFEWVPNPEENTNFDFFIQQTSSSIPDVSKQIFFEIKYTERGFGQCEDDERHQNKFKDIYTPMISNCACLSKNPSFEEFKEFYQLFRNTLRITKENWRNEYVVFLFPRENVLALKHYDAFDEKFIDQKYQGHIKRVFWEDMTECMSYRFREKFFFYTI
jgi:hypothetical protein